MAYDLLLLLTALVLPTPQSLALAEYEILSDSLVVVTAPDPVELPRAYWSLLVWGQRMQLVQSLWLWGESEGYAGVVLELRAVRRELGGCPLVGEGHLYTQFPDHPEIMELWRQNRRLAERVREWGEWNEYKRPEADRWSEWLKWQAVVLDRVYELRGGHYSVLTRRRALHWLLREFGPDRVREGRLPLTPVDPFK